MLEPHTARNRESKDGFDGGGAAKRSESIPRGLPLRPPRIALLFSLRTRPRSGISAHRSTASDRGAVAIRSAHGAAC